MNILYLIFFLYIIIFIYVFFFECVARLLVLFRGLGVKLELLSFVFAFVSICGDAVDFP